MRLRSSGIGPSSGEDSQAHLATSAAGLFGIEIDGYLELAFFKTKAPSVQTVMAMPATRNASL